MASFLDVVRFVPTAGGTTDWTYSSAVTGYQSPTAAGVVNGSLYRYRAESADLTQWEVGSGTYNTSSGVLARTTVLFNSSGTTSKISFSATPQVAIVALAEDLSILFSQIRLTLTQGTAVTTADVTAATSLYLEPYNGSKASVYDGVAYWATLEIAASTYSIAATQSQTGTRASAANAIVSGLTDTSQLTVGMQISGTGIGVASVILTIDSATQVTGTVNNTGTGTTSVTFKLPPSTNYDVYLTNSSGIPKLLWSAAWSNDTTPPTRAVQNGVEVASGATTKLLIGAVRSTTVAGQLEDSHTHRYVSNRYNEQPRPMYATDAAASWTYSTATYRQANANTGNQFDYICCVARPIWSQVIAQAVNNTGVNNVNVGIGIDTASASSAQLVRLANLSGTTYVPTDAIYTGTPGIGRHYVTWLEFGGGTNTQTWLGTAANNISGIIGEVAA